MPDNIIPIKDIKLSASFVRFHYYALHNMFFETRRRIYDSFIDFLHTVFEEKFQNAEKTTTKNKFSVQPNLYKKDLEKMKQRS